VLPGLADAGQLANLCIMPVIIEICQTMTGKDRHRTLTLTLPIRSSENS
jgi:hypothetical protein